MACDPLPPGETGTELNGSDAIGALHDALIAMSNPARLKFSKVKDIDVRKAGRWILITVKHDGKDSNEVTFRIQTPWAKTLQQRLTRVLR